MKLEDSISVLKGVGPKRKEILATQQIFTIEDLLKFYPKKYLNRQLINHEDEIIYEEPNTIKAMVSGQGNILRRPGGLSLFTLPLLWNEKKVTGVFFNQPYLKGNFRENQTYFFYGKIQGQGKGFKLLNPQFVLENNPGEFFALTSVYRKIQGVPNEGIRKMLHQVFESGLSIEEDLPLEILEAYGLKRKEEALKSIHFPEKMEEILSGKRRLKFEEALKINLGILSNNDQTKVSNIEISYTTGIQPIINHLPYELTKSQKAVLEDIQQDLKSRKVMNRLVQGDVGSGKTVIAIMSAALMAQNGYQTAYMAPTEILAQQHGRNFSEILKNTAIKIEIITGSIKAKEKREILKRIAEGETQIIIGTHALIQESVDYYNLGLVITDEQHRFGVKQRGKLSLKGQQPHTMVMSATPIPRTLALILYGDLSVSYIDELPQGRKLIKTYCYDEASLNKIYHFMEGEVQKGRQGFIICPFIEASEEMDNVRDIETVFKEVKDFFKDKYAIRFLHSRLSNDEKEKIIQTFNAGNIDLLVATSIIEVGIDVPNVSVITILSAERFGLSQLHQLRGRVGRGKHQSYCFLVTNSKAPETLGRMEVIVKNSSGKKIADEDYKMRGPGDYFGLRQHGFPEFDLLNPLEDLELIQVTKELGKKMFRSGKKEDILYREKTVKAFYKEVEEISLN
ncbi:MAG: ATP-dependent DNA helicase RecG [Eubacteriaceae bacterium]